MDMVIDRAALDPIFRQARTHHAWLDRPAPESLLRKLHELARMGPTSGKRNPMRVVLVTSREGKERLRPGLKPGNVDKTMTAPATAIIGPDMEFYEHIPRLALTMRTVASSMRRTRNRPAGPRSETPLRRAPT